MFSEHNIPRHFWPKNPRNLQKSRKILKKHINLRAAHTGEQFLRYENDAQKKVSPLPVQGATARREPPTKGATTGWKQHGNSLHWHRRCSPRASGDLHAMPATLVQPRHQQQHKTPAMACSRPRHVGLPRPLEDLHATLLRVGARRAGISSL